METFGTKKISEISAKYYCEICNFKCSRASEWNIHVHRPKHLNGNLELNKSPLTDFICKCGNIYTTKSGLWKHHKKCNYTDNTSICNINTDNAHLITTNSSEDFDDKPSAENLFLSNLILEVVKQNKELMKENSEFKDMMLEQNKMMLELAKNAGTNNNTMTNSHNKTFNLQIFLNETCKDAMNIMDFVDSLKLQLCDLERIGEVGFVTGISDIIIKNLKALDVSKRPVHCADTKREVMYVKDNNKWEKEQEGNKKLKKAIKHIAKKNSMNINLFKDKYPDCINSYSRKSDQFNKIYIEAYGGSGNEDVDNENKIIKNIAKVVFIDKTL
jgi:hypothetical protein